MFIAIDYDDTYTADPELWEAIMKLMESRRHIPVIVTFRDEKIPGHKISGLNWEIFYTAGIPKAEYMRMNDIDVGIWCDDWPELIGPTR
jgi:hypothetical protein